jgi:hypothetical protein
MACAPAFDATGRMAFRIATGSPFFAAVVCPHGVALTLPWWPIL